MPTVDQWKQALSRPYRLKIESSLSLCQDVESRRRDKARERGRQPPESKDLSPWPAPSGRQESIDVRPIDMLHALGRITTPPITELIDLSSTWAELRYVWAFRPNPNSSRPRPLQLNDAAKNLDFHQKTLLSDEFGVGFAAYYMVTVESASDPVDVFIAKRQPQLRLRRNSRRSLPDYIFKGPRHNQYFVVECKGTQSQRPAAIRQLQRGTEQVVTVGIDSPALTTHLVIGALLSGNISLFVIDPVEGSEPRILTRWTIESLRRFSDAKKLTYIGNYTGARKLLPEITIEAVSGEYEEWEPDVRETANGVFEGSAEIRRTPDGRELRMFRGLRSGEPRRSGQPIETPVSTDVPPRRSFILESDVDGRTALLRSISPDGSLFEVEVR